MCISVNGNSHQPGVPQQQESLKQIICLHSGCQAVDYGPLSGNQAWNVTPGLSGCLGWDASPSGKIVGHGLRGLEWLLGGSLHLQTEGERRDDEGWVSQWGWDTGGNTSNTKKLLEYVIIFIYCKLRETDLSDILKCGSENVLQRLIEIALKIRISKMYKIYQSLTWMTRCRCEVKKPPVRSSDQAPVSLFSLTIQSTKSLSKLHSASV